MLVGGAMARAKIKRVGGIRAVRGIFHLVRFDEFVMDLKGADEFVDGGAVMRRKARRDRGDRERAVAKRTLSGPCQVRGVSAARERNNQGTSLGKARQERKLFLFRWKARIFGNANWNECSHRESV